MKILQPKEWMSAKGYSNGIVTQGEQIFLAGQIGWDKDQRFVSDDFAEQTAQALRNIVVILAEAGAKPEHLVRLTWFVTNKKEYLDGAQKIGQHYRAIIGKHFPAMTLVEVKSLLEDGAKVEIEATAVIPE